MAKAIITSILEAQLGKYVEGLRSDSLEIGLWSGELELRDLTLKTNALSEFQLPVTISSGYVSRVVVHVPWNQLGSASVTITLEGVTALVVPNTERATRPELLQIKKTQLERRELVRQHGRFAARVERKEEETKSDDESTFISRLTARIVDNLQVTLVHVHLRYEDARANPDSPFACGVMLETFRYLTTDGAGEEVFVDENYVHDGFTYKKAELTQFGMYWDRLDPKNVNARLETCNNAPKVMRQMVQALSKQEDWQIDTKRRWVLRPCLIMAQLTKNESADYSTIAKYTIEAEIGALEGSLTREQYEDVLFLQRAFLGRRAVEAHFALARGRPLHPPVARPQEWWDYATRLVLEQRRTKNRANATGDDASDNVTDCRRYRRPHYRTMRWSSVHKALLEQQLYVEAYRTEVRNNAPLDPLSKQGKFKQYFEEIYPIDVVLLLRDVAEDAEERAQEEAKNSAKAQLKAQDEQKSGGSWYSYFFGGDTVAAEQNEEEEEESQVLSAEGRENLREAYNDAVKKADSAHEVPMGCNLMSVQIQLSNGTMSLYQSNTHENPFLSGTLNGSLAMNIQPENEWDARLRIQHFNVLNWLAMHTRFHSFCSPSSSQSIDDDQINACVSIDVSRRAILHNQVHSDDGFGTTLKVRVSSEPIRVMVDPSFVMFLNAFFISLLPESQLEKVWQFATSSVADWMFADDCSDDEKLLGLSELSAQKKMEEAELMRSLERAEGRVEYDVLVNVNAPVLILPENVGDTTGAVLVVDLGMLSFCNEEKLTATDTSLDVVLDPAVGNLRRLHWRLEMTNIHVLLGCQERLIEWTDAELRSFTKIVEELSIGFSLHTQSSSSRLRLPSRSRKNIVAAKPLPQVGIYAAIPTIIVSLAENQLVALGHIYSSIVRARTAARGNDERLSYFEGQEFGSGEQSATESANISDSSASNTIFAASSADEKYLLEMQLSLTCVEFNLRESAVKDAFVLRASHTSFAVETYSAHQLFHSRLKALVMEDKLYLPGSRYYKLISTGETESDAHHLITLDVAAYSSNSAKQKEQYERGKPLQLEADVQFNVLHVQWNPSSVALFYRILSAYASAIRVHTDDVSSEDSTSPLERRTLSLYEPYEQYQLELARHMQRGIKKERTASTSSLRSRGQPVIVVRASLVQVSLTFNKDQLDRQLACLKMSDAAVCFTSYTVDGRTSSDDDTFEVTGHVGNFVGTDLSTSKHPLYSTLLGLDEDEAHRRCDLGKGVEALLTFEFASDPVASDKRFMRLAFQPIRGVYYHQQVLELVDFVLEGVLGAIVSQTLVNATQLLLRKDQAEVVLDLSVEKPIVILPLSLQDAPHLKVTADVLRLVHFPFSTVHYEGSIETRTKRVVHDGALRRPISRISVDKGNSVSLQVDCKDVYLEQVRVFCTVTTAGKKTKSADGGPVYENVLVKPVDLKVSIEDLVSSSISLDEEEAADGCNETKTVYLPRFTVHSVLPPLEVHLSRTSYLGIVALVLENFGADEFQMVPTASEETDRASSAIRYIGRRRSSAGVPSLRPTVTYTYLQPDADEATLHVQFAMENIRIVLLPDEKVKTIARKDLPSDLIVQHTFMNHAKTLRNEGFAEIVATDFTLLFCNEYNKKPRLMLRLGAFNIRDLIGKYSPSASGTECGTLVVSPYPLEIRYTWDDIALTGEMDLSFSDVAGTIIPEAMFALFGFFALPSKPSRVDTASDSSFNDATNEHSLPPISPSPSFASRRESISDILRDGREPELTLTVRATAKRVGVALPRDAYDSESPRVAFVGDFTLQYTWRPQPDLTIKKADGDLDIQSSILADARNMEIVLENARRPGCCVASSSSTSQWDVIDVAPLIQLLEPCDLYLEVSSLFPHAGQRQQIVALKFTPVEVFISYDDALMAMDTMEHLNEAIAQYKKRRSASDTRHLSCDDNSTFRLRGRSRTSSRSIFGDTTMDEVEIHGYFTCELPSVNLTLINDCDGCDMGLTQLQIKRCHVFLNVTHTGRMAVLNETSTFFSSSNLSALPVTTTVSGGGRLVVLMSFYNPDTRDWHPMCTEWALDTSVQGSISSESELHVILTASQSLDLTVTHGLLDVMASVGGAWKRRAARIAAKECLEDKKDAENKQREMAPCVVRNDTGLPLKFWLTNGSFTTEPEVVPTGSLADVHYVHAQGRGRGVVRRYAFGDRDAANLRLSLQLMDTKTTGGGGARFQSIQGLIFEQLGARTFPLVDTHGQRTSFTLSLSAELVEGRILLFVSSPIKLVNRLASRRSVALLVNDPTWHSPVEIGILRPNQDSAVPVLLSLALELRLRPVEDEGVYAWSAPIPIQTRSAVEQKVEAAVSSTSSVREGVGNEANGRKAVYCVSMSSEKEMRVVSVAEPLVLVNELPLPLTYRVRSASSSAYGLGTSGSPSKPESIAAGAKSSVWWTDISQRPLFQLLVEGCTTQSKWLELAPRGTASGAVLSVQLSRVDDGRPFRLLLRVVGGSDYAARSVRVEILADVWVINRTGLELVYGTAADNEAYIPPRAARAQVGNAQISPYSSDNSGKVPMLRIGLRGCSWSARFEADPKRLSWQNECIRLHSAGRNTSSGGVLYELGVSADYATRHFGSVTTLVSVIPRYLIFNRSPHTLLLFETSDNQLRRLEGTSTDNVAHHVLSAGDMYALYWVGGSRVLLCASVLLDVDASGTLCSEGYDRSAAFSIDCVGTTNLLVPPRSSGRGVRLEVVVKQGSLSQATFVVVVTDAGAEVAPPTSQTLSRSNPTASSSARTAVTNTGAAGWQIFSLHAQLAGVIVTVTDQKNGGMVEGPPSLFSDNFEGASEPVARATLTLINMEASWSPEATVVKFNLMGLKVEDLLPESENRVVLRPLLQRDSASFSVNRDTDKHFLELTYRERPHAKHTWVEHVHLELQNMKLSTSMRFIDRINKLIHEISAHFRHKLLVSALTGEESSNVDDDEKGDLLAYFVPQNEEGDDGTSVAGMTAMTGQKLYIESGLISPVCVVVSFTRDKSGSKQQENEGFWLSNLKLKIENACVTLEGYRLSRALATQESLSAAITRFYQKSVKSQALNLIESIEVTSLVTSMVTGGVTSLVSSLRGKADPAAAAGARAPGLLTSSFSNADSDTSLSIPFCYEQMSINKIIRKHSRALDECRSSTELLRQVRHLVYDWDANHTGLEARGCVVVALINNSRYSLVVNTKLNDGASLRVLPLGRRHLASVLDAPTETASNWRADRAIVVFAYGYTPTLLTSGDVYFTVQSNACNVYATRKTARLQANRGYTATFTLQETQNWWSVNVIIIGDDLQVTDSSTSATDSASLFGEARAVTDNDAAFAAGNNEFEVEFPSVSLGLIAEQSGHAVIVRKCIPSSAAAASGRIAAGDYVLAVNGMSVANTAQFKALVSNTPRPIVLRFRRQCNAAYDLFGEHNQEENGLRLFG